MPWPVPGQDRTRPHTGRRIVRPHRRPRRRRQRRRVVGQRVAFLGSGGLAEQVTHPAAGVFAVPEGVSAETAAAIPINYCTTLYALHDRAHLQPGETVLITGAAGGTGTAAIQLAKAAGARTIAIAGGQTKVDLVRERRRRRRDRPSRNARLGRRRPRGVGWRRRRRLRPGRRRHVPPGPSMHGMGRPIAGDRIRGRDPRGEDQPRAAQELLDRRCPLGCVARQVPAIRSASR